jgi:hypothetical protein
MMTGRGTFWEVWEADVDCDFSELSRFPPRFVIYLLSEDFHSLGLIATFQVLFVFDLPDVSEVFARISNLGSPPQKYLKRESIGNIKLHSSKQ